MPARRDPASRPAPIARGAGGAASSPHPRHLPAEVADRQRVRRVQDLVAQELEQQVGLDAGRQVLPADVRGPEARRTQITEAFGPVTKLVSISAGKAAIAVQEALHLERGSRIVSPVKPSLP